MSDTPVELKYAYRLSAIRLQNFMAFEDTGWIELRPITLLFGRNSSGKSAIIRALLLLKQSLESRDANAPLIFSGAFVDLGSYYNAVHRHELKRDISFGFRLSRPPFEEPLPADSASKEEKEAYAKRLQMYKNSKAQWLRSSSELPAVYVDDSPLELHLTFGLVNKNSPPILKSLAIYGYRTPDDGQPKAVRVFRMARRGDGSWKPQSDVPLHYEEVVGGERDNRRSVKRKQFSNLLWANLIPDMGSGCIPRRLWLPDAANFLQSDRPPDWQVVDGALEFFWEHLTTLLRGMVYLPPLRDEPRRYYRADYGWVREITKEKLQEINQWLRDAAINAEVFVKTLADQEGIFAVYLREKSKDLTLDTNLRDVGSGVSQVLPVIIESLQSLEDRLVIVEQPELHLHPSAQAELADMFIKMILRRQHRSAPAFLIETHSENLLLRFRVRLAQTAAYDDQELKLYQKDFGAIFVERNGLKANVETIEFDGLGAYIQQPKGFIEFFGDDFNELQSLRRARADAAIKE